MSLFADAAFRCLCLAGLGSGVVRWLEVLAFGTYTYLVTDSAFTVVVVVMLRQLPMALLGIFAGAIADRVDRRRTLLFGYALMLLQTAILTALAFSGRLEIWHLALASFFGGAFWTGDNPLRRTMIGEVVGTARMGAAMAVDSSINNLTRLLGPALGGALLALVGIEGVILASGAFYALGLGAMLRLRWAPMASVGARPGVLSSILTGFALLRTERRLQGTLAITALFNIFGWPATSLIPVIGRDDLDLGPALVGLLQSAEGIGGLFCGFAVIWLIRPQHYVRLYIGGALCFQFAIIVFALTPLPAPAYFAWVIAGCGAAAIGAMQPTLTLLYAPPETAGRMMGMLSMCQGIGLLGFLLLSLLPGLVGAATAVLTIGLLGLAGILASWLYWRELR